MPNRLFPVLETENVKYKLTKNGTEIMVPQSEVNRLRVNTAEIALSSGGANVGYEIFDQSDALGSTNFCAECQFNQSLGRRTGAYDSLCR